MNLLPWKRRNDSHEVVGASVPARTDEPRSEESRVSRSFNLEDGLKQVAEEYATAYKIRDELYGEALANLIAQGEEQLVPMFEEAISIAGVDHDPDRREQMLAGTPGRQKQAKLEGELASAYANIVQITQDFIKQRGNFQFYFSLNHDKSLLEFDYQSPMDFLGLYFILNGKAPVFNLAGSWTGPGDREEGHAGNEFFNNLGDAIGSRYGDRAFAHWFPEEPEFGRSAHMGTAAITIHIEALAEGEQAEVDYDVPTGTRFYLPVSEADVVRTGTGYLSPSTHSWRTNVSSIPTRYDDKSLVMSGYAPLELEDRANRSFTNISFLEYARKDSHYLHFKTVGRLMGHLQVAFDGKAGLSVDQKS